MKSQIKTLSGIGVSNGIALGKAVIVKRQATEIVEKEISIGQIDKEQKRFFKARDITFTELQKIREKTSKSLGEKSAEIIDAQLLLLQDNYLIASILENIEVKKRNAEFSVETTMNDFIAEFAQRSSGNEFLSDRIQDLKDLKARLIENLIGEEKTRLFENVDEESILITTHLAPSESVQLFGKTIGGLVTERGGKTSHIAIILKTLEIPAVVGVDNACNQLIENSFIIIDGFTGTIFLNPNESLIKKYQDKKKAFEETISHYLDIAPLIPITKDEHRVTVSANIEIPEELQLVKKYGAEGVGLFRTELLYISQEDFPTESYQTKVYSDLAQKLSPNPLIIRTFDIGGDKLLYRNSHSLEPNPFLGWRAIRIGLSHPKVMKSQLRAIFKASAFGNVKLMFPMISSNDEISRLRELADESCEELRKDGEDFNEKLEIGIMVEIPSAALLAKQLAKNVDFFSIGTNDLIQYTLAVDRGNQKVAEYYQSYHPSVIRLIKETVDGAHSENKWVGICGEMGGDTNATIFLLGLGIDEFSCTPQNVPSIKEIIRSVNYSDAKDVADKCIRANTQNEILDILKETNCQLIPDLIE